MCQTSYWKIIVEEEKETPIEVVMEIPQIEKPI